MRVCLRNVRHKVSEEACRKTHPLTTITRKGDQIGAALMRSTRDHATFPAWLRKRSPHMNVKPNARCHR
eukprot:scaffold49653_cov31-Tisochrysis_lutea.AAC.4